MSKAQITHAQQRCAWCEGTGKKALSAGYIISCLVCGGKGHIMMIQPTEQCRQCEGSGRRNITGSCLNCAGTGWSRVFAQG
jgi:DnaJ-class molecular chaperone